jgi:hypothetical protein
MSPDKTPFGVQLHKNGNNHHHCNNDYYHYYYVITICSEPFRKESVWLLSSFNNIATKHFPSVFSFCVSGKEQQFTLSRDS